jgi:CRISPR/Cas system CMR-associated protein Cmr5 small subunit
MPFKKGETPKGAKVFKKGESGNPAGKPKGTKHGSTLLKELLALDNNELKMHLAQISKAIEKEDTNAYKAVLDRAFGTAVQHIEQTNIDTNLPEWLDKDESES